MASNSSRLQREDFDSGPSCLDLIDDNLWLGNLAAATDTETLDKLRIDHILTVDSCPIPRTIKEIKNMKTKFIQVTDSPREDLLTHLEESFEFIETGRNNGVVLVHCYFGVSRSATLVIAYIMKKQELSLMDAMKFVQSKRRFVSPNPGFMAQLSLYEIMKCTIDKHNVQYRMFRLKIAADHVKKVKIVPQCCVDVIKPDPALITVRPDPRVYKCRKCRRTIALASNILPHAPKEKYSWRDSRWTSDDELSSVSVCDKTYFIEPLAWMTSVVGSLEGKLICPKCDSKLGSFSWIMGCQCPCGTKVSPAFYLIPSKVERSNHIQNVQATV